MSVNKVNQSTGELSPIAGGTLYADAPVGTIQAYGGATAPWGWLLCQGQAISRTTYAELFNVIGTSFGEGDGSSTFNVPDLQGKTLVGYNSSETEFNAIGKTGGEKTHTLTISEMPSHNHIPSGKPYASASIGGTNRLASSSGANENMQLSTAIIPAGGDQPHNILQPYNTVNYIIKVTTIALPSDFEAAVDEKIAAVDFNGKQITPSHIKVGMTAAAATTITSYSSFTGNYLGFLFEMGSARVPFDIPKMMFSTGSGVTTRLYININSQCYGILHLQYANGNVEAYFLNSGTGGTGVDCYLWAFTHN